MKFITVIILLGVFCIARGDYYSAISGLESLLKNEVFLAENLQNYVQGERFKISNLREQMKNIKLELERIKNDPADYYGNPLNAWKAIKRLTLDWQDYVQIAFKETNEDVYLRKLTAYDEDIKITKPSNEDLRGAAKGVSRLQITYNLETTQLANGTIMGKIVSDEMSAADCFALGSSLLAENDFKNAAIWLLEARRRLKQEKLAGKRDGIIKIPQESQILESLETAYLANGNTKLALWLAKEHLELDPTDEIALANLEKVEKRINAERLVLDSGHIEEPAKKRATLNELYEQTCRGDRKQTPSEQRNLSCRYESNNAPYCSIAPFKMEQLSLDPFVAVYYDVIYDNEIENIIKVSTQDVERSGVGDGGSKTRISDVRTSQNTWLSFQKYEFLKNIAFRLNYITGLSLESAESLQVANYGIGGHYGPHYDFSEVKNYTYEGKGSRILTALFYINDVEFGGATAFPYLKLVVPPVKKSLLVWHNLHRSLEFDYRTKHAGCPVIKGSKWICNEWYHTLGQEFLRSCDLQPDGYKSIDFSDENMWYK